MYLPILGALALATGTIIERLILKRKNISIKFYETYSFLAIILVMLPFVFLFWKVSPEALNAKNILLFVVIAITAVLANLFTYFSMKWEKVSNLEPAKITEPIFTILLAIIFSFIFGEALFERNSKIIIPALIAGIALIFSHIKKHHLEFNRYFIAAIAGSFFFALELVLSRLILDYYSPFTFYFIRCVAIFLFGFIVFREKVPKEFDSHTIFHTFLAAAIWVIYRIVVYYGYIKVGVISTTLLLLLGPIFTYFLAWKFLKEKPSWRNILASIVIIACVAYAIFA